MPCAPCTTQLIGTFGIAQKATLLALELTVKATLAGRRVAEVPTTWRDRTAGQSNFKLRKWLPHDLRWYWTAFRGRFAAIARRRLGRGT